MLVLYDKKSNVFRSIFTSYCMIIPQSPWNLLATTSSSLWFVANFQFMKCLSYIFNLIDLTLNFVPNIFNLHFRLLKRWMDRCKCYSKDGLQQSRKIRKSKKLLSREFMSLCMRFGVHRVKVVVAA